MKYSCSCKSNKSEHKHHHTTFSETEVDSDGVCLKCGYYAVKETVTHEHLFRNPCEEEEWDF